MGIFEHLAATDDSARVAARKAVAVANKRVSEYLGDFLKRASSVEERQARLALVEEDVTRIVADVTDQYGGDPAHTLAAIREVLGCDESESESEGEDDDGDSDDWDPSESESSKKKNPFPFKKKDKDDKESRVAGPLGPEATPEGPQTVNLEPNWEQMRAWLTNMAKTDPEGAAKIAEAMGAEAPPELVGGALPLPGPQEPPVPGGETGSAGGPVAEDYFASVRTARRPKMCPYHSELVDSSLQAGEPQYSAFSGLVGGPSHCKGGFDGSCNFKPDMVTQSYWDKKSEEYADRRRQRELERSQPEPINTIPEPTMPSADDGEGITDLDTELTEAPSAVGGGESEHFAEEPSMAMAAAQRTAEAPRDGGGAVTTEELKPGNKDALGKPSPKIDKTTWKPNALNDSGNLKPIDTEQSGSPHATDSQDVTDKPDWEEDTWPPASTNSVTDRDELSGTDDDAVSTERNIDQPHTDTWGEDGMADPITRSNPEAIVSAVQDPNKNPIREVLTSEWPTEAEISQAIASYQDQG